MKTFTKGLSVALLLGLGFSAHAQKHVHGREGELLIAQEGSLLQMQFIIPAADALGFEHQAANSSDKNAINVLAQQLKNSSHAIDIKGQCILQSTENSLAHSHMKMSTMSTIIIMLKPPTILTAKHRLWAFRSRCLT